MKAAVDKSLCIGCGLCASDCPGVFAMNDDSIAVVVAEPVPAERRDSCRLAEKNCPVAAIKVTD